jgi:hypothetical protein
MLMFYKIYVWNATSMLLDNFVHPSHTDTKH